MGEDATANENSQAKGQPIRWTGFTFALIALSLLGAMFSFVLGFAGVMSSDGCQTGDTQFICTGTGQRAAFWLPWISWVAALILSLATAGIAARKRVTPWVGIPVGALAYGLVIAIGSAISKG